MNSRRVGGEHHAQHRGRGLKAPDDTVFLSITRSQYGEIEAPGQSVQDLLHGGQDEVKLLHVLAAHVLGQAGGRRLVPHELVGSLATIPGRKLGGHEQIRRLRHPVDQLPNRDLPEGVPGPLPFSHVAGDHPADGLADFRQRLPGDEVDNLVHFQALVGLAPTKNGKMDHRTPPGL